MHNARPDTTGKVIRIAASTGGTVRSIQDPTLDPAGQGEARAMLGLLALTPSAS